MENNELNVGKVFVGGDVTSAKGTDSARISADKLLETLIIGGNVKGTATRPVWITAGGIAGNATAALSSVWIGGNVESTNIVADLGMDGMAGDTPDASIREIFVGKNWKASNAVAGLAPGMDSFYGTNDSGAEQRQHHPRDWHGPDRAGAVALCLTPCLRGKMPAGRASGFRQGWPGA